MFKIKKKTREEKKMKRQKKILQNLKVSEHYARIDEEYLYLNDLEFLYSLGWELISRAIYNYEGSFWFKKMKIIGETK